MKKLILPVILLFVLSSFTAHKFYVSLTEIEYVEDKKSLQIISKVFLDDIEAVLSERYGDDVSFTRDRTKKASAEKMLTRYYRQKLILEIEGKPLNLSYIGSEVEADQLVCYFEVINVSPFSSLTVRNLVLMDLFDDQQNIVHATVNEKTKSMMAVTDRESQVLKFR